MAHWLTRWARPGAGGWLLCAMLLAWELVSRFAIVPGYLLPAPVTVAQSLVQGISDGPLFQHARSTATAAVLGYVCGACVAFGVGVLVASSAWAERFLLVPLTAVQSIPKVALAPLVFVWLGFGIESTVTLVALACFYPVFANTVIGLRTADGELLELYRALGASRRRILLEVRIPHAAPLLFNALQLTAVFALIAAVVMEFVASTRGLGYLPCWCLR